MRDAVIIDAVRTPVGIGKPDKGQLQQERRDRQSDEDVGHGGTGRDRCPYRGLRLRALGSGQTDALPALEPDRCGHHAFGADRPIAARAPDVGGSIRMDRAGGNLGRIRDLGQRISASVDDTIFLGPADVDGRDHDLLHWSVVRPGLHLGDGVHDVT